MPFASHSIVGMIAVQPDLAAGAGRSRIADDQTLGSLLASLGHCTSLEASCGQPASFVATTRVSRFIPADLAPFATIRADLARLTDDLADEYELVCGR